MTKCSGRLCEYSHICQHAIEGKKKTHTKGKWIKVLQCRFGVTAADGKTVLRLPFADLQLKEIK